MAADRFLVRSRSRDRSGNYMYLVADVVPFVLEHGREPLRRSWTGLLTVRPDSQMWPAALLPASTAAHVVLLLQAYTDWLYVHRPGRPLIEAVPYPGVDP